MQIRVWVRVRCGDPAIFDKVGCGYGEIHLLINHYLYFLYIANRFFFFFKIIVNIYQFKSLVGNKVRD